MSTTLERLSRLGLAALTIGCRDEAIAAFRDLVRWAESGVRPGP